MTKKKATKKTTKKTTKKVVKPKMVEIEVDLPTDIIEWVNKVAAEEGITFDEVVNNAVRDFIKLNQEK